MTTQLLMSNPRKIVFAAKTANTSSFCINYEDDGNTTWAIAFQEDTHAFFYEDEQLFPLSYTPRVKLSNISLISTQQIVGRTGFQANEKGCSYLITNYCYLYMLKIWGKNLHMPFHDLVANYLKQANSLFTVNLN
jgi:hypothetical protein